MEYIFEYVNLIFFSSQIEKIVDERSFDWLVAGFMK